MRRVSIAVLVLAAITIGACSEEESSSSRTTVTVRVEASEHQRLTSGLEPYEPGVCPYPRRPVDDGFGGQVVRPRIMSEYQPSLKEAALQAARPCFPGGATLYFREVASEVFPDETRPQVSDGNTCFTFGYSSGGGRWRISGQIDGCPPFGPDAG